MNDELRFKIDNLPESPGCYLMKNAGEIIYVGKAKNLKNRVRQYFLSPERHTPKVRAMVERVEDFDTMLVDNELEAFTLECNLIKLHKPFYNILLKDDKHYPYLRLDMREAFPRLEIVRRVKNDGARYFGPYFGATVVKDALDVVRRVFPIRSCSLNLPSSNPLRPCVHYEIGQCPAPCAGKIESAEYKKTIARVADFLNGKYELVVDELKRGMAEASAKWSFERAALYRDQIRAVEALMQKQKAIVAAGGDQDVIAAESFENGSQVELLYVREGRLIGGDHFEMENSLGETPEETLSQFMSQFYDQTRLPPREILVSKEVPDLEWLEDRLSSLRGQRVHILTPKRGGKRKLALLAEKNLAEKAQKLELKRMSEYARTIGALDELKGVLGLGDRPRRIEGYDISNTQGALSVGSMVVMIDGVSAKKEYRQFRIKTVEGPNDFDSMREVITRRLSHGLRDQMDSVENSKFADLPDLILIDGGRGQLSAAQEAMRETGLAIPMFGLAKRVEEIVLPDAAESILLDRHSPALQLIQRLRDEAHRFAITRHRALRASKSISSKLDDIPGVGKARKRALLTRFKSVSEIMAASAAEIAETDGVSQTLAEKIYEYIHSNSNGGNDDGLPKA